MRLRLLDKLMRMAAMTVAALAFAFSAQAQIPDRPEPPRLVNDIANLLTSSEVDLLESKLVDFDNKTSTQITIVTVTNLADLPVAMFAEQLGDKWGVGRKGKNNGVVIIVKPKTQDSAGEAFIGTGYGVEGALPDAVCHRIVNQQMIPHFKTDDYSAGIAAGAQAVMDAVRGEYTNDETDSIGEGNFKLLFIASIIALIALYVAAKVYIERYKKAKSRREKITTTMTFFFVIATIFSFIVDILFRIAGSMSKGSKNGGSSSGSGGFGGFGGGSFGGGGGGGRW